MRTLTIIFSAGNVLAMLWLLVFVLHAKSMALAEERDAYDFGDSIGFLLYVGPAILLCAISDIIWAATALLAVVRRRGFREAVACAGVLALWVVVLFAARGLSDLPSNPVLQRMASPSSELAR